MGRLSRSFPSTISNPDNRHPKLCPRNSLQRMRWSTIRLTSLKSANGDYMEKDKWMKTRPTLLAVAPSSRSDTKFTQSSVYWRDLPLFAHPLQQFDQSAFTKYFLFTAYEHRVHLLGKATRAKSTATTALAPAFRPFSSNRVTMLTEMVPHLWLISIFLHPTKAPYDRLRQALLEILEHQELRGLHDRSIVTTTMIKLLIGSRWNIFVLRQTKEGVRH